MSIKEHPPHHIPVLLKDVVTLLSPQEGETYLDLTAGYGGHASAILAKTENYNGSVLVDRDDFAITQLSPLATRGVQLVHSDFLTAAKQLVQEKATFDLLLLDLGVSSPQLDQSERGFSFSHNGPLDMRMDRRQEKTAATVVNQSSVPELTHIIYEYGEEPYRQAERIAQAIHSFVTTEGAIETTQQLAEIVALLFRGRRTKTHPATRTFQAIRIAVNDELRQVEELLPYIPQLLNKNGRVAIISFHSLEDRLVKRYFKAQRDAGLESQLHEVTKKPIAGNISDVHNPRSRSAKLRVAVKI